MNLYESVIIINISLNSDPKQRTHFTGRSKQNTEIFPTLEHTNLGRDLLSAWPQLDFEGTDYVQRAWRRTGILFVVS